MEKIEIKLNEQLKKVTRVVTFYSRFKENVEDYLRQSDIYISASRTEGLPLSVLEAMACGLPVIATDAGGTRDIVKDGINGFIVNVDDEDGIKEALLKLIDNKVLRKSYSVKSREIAKQWSLENCTRGYEILYES